MAHESRHFGDSDFGVLSRICAEACRLQVVQAQVQAQVLAQVLAQVELPLSPGSESRVP